MTNRTKPLVPQASRSRAATALLPRFLGHRRRDVASIRAALASDDFETVARLGHNMRGSGVSYGFPNVSLIGEELEAAADARDARRVDEQLALLEAWVAGVADMEIAHDAAPRTESGTHVRAVRAPGEGGGGGGDAE